MIICGDAYDELIKISDNSIDLILIDPPYLISRDSNFKKGNNKKFDFSIDFGEWDKGELDWDLLMENFYRILKRGGTLLTFYDVWKSESLKKFATKWNFKQPRIGIWVKNNPVPINSKTNYLSNSSEYFFSFVKDSKPTFNSIYDKGMYNYPLCHGLERSKHPTQKPLKLIEELIKKHSNPGDLVLDCFAGSGTTGEACILNDRRFILIENNGDYFDIIKKRLPNINI